MYLTINLKRAYRKILLFAIAAMILIAAGLYVRLRFPLKYIGIIKEYSALNNLDPAFVCAVINAESRFRKEAVSHKGASGLMQLTAVTADWIAREMNIPNYTYDKIFEPELNISIGSYYLRRLENQYDKRTDLMLAAYNAGSGNVAKWLNNPEYSPDGVTLAHIPFPETRQYIIRVNRNYKIYSFFLKYFK